MQINQIKPWFYQQKNFLLYDIWSVNFQQLSKGRRIWFKILKIAMLLVDNLRSDNCYLRASALTLYSIFAVVPVVALLFAIAKGFGMEQLFYQTMLERFAEQKVVVETLFGFAEKTLEHTRGGLIAGVGVAVLLFTIIKMIGHIEMSFNHIWSVNKNRSWFRKFTDYTSLLLICPILLIVAAGLNPLVDRLMAGGWIWEPLTKPFGTLMVWLLPFVLTCFIFSFVYRFMPNTRVSLGAAILAGVISGTVFRFWQILYFTVQVKLSSYNAIYGSLSALPLFLLWMQYSWIIVLFGTELAFVLQNAENIEFEPGANRPSPCQRRSLSLLLTALIARDFRNGAGPRDTVALAHACKMPIRLTEFLLFQLQEAGVLCQVMMPESVPTKTAFVPALPLEQLTVGKVLHLLDHFSSGNQCSDVIAEYVHIQQFAARQEEALRQAGLDVQVEELLNCQS